MHRKVRYRISGPFCKLPRVCANRRINKRAFSPRSISRGAPQFSNQTLVYVILSLQNGSYFACELRISYECSTSQWTIVFLRCMIQIVFK